MICLLALRDVLFPMKRGKSIAFFRLRPRMESRRARKLSRWDVGVARVYTKNWMPLGEVKDKKFLSRPMDCKGVGFSFVRYRSGEGATYGHCHKVQEEVFITLKATGSLILDGKRFSMPEGTCTGLRRGLIGHWAAIRKRTWCI